MSEPSAAELVALQEVLYDSSNPTRRWLHVARRDWVQQAISEYGKGAGRALEVGPGSGVYLPDLLQVAAEVVASDIEEAYLQQARQLAESEPALTVRRDDITATEQASGQYQLVLCTEVIEHIADSDAAIAGLARLVTDDGVIILTTPQRDSPLELCAKVAFLPGIIQLVRMIYREPIIPTGHINLLTEKGLRQQIADNGLVVERVWKSGFYLPLVAELGGEAGCRFLRWCELKLRNGPLSGLLWTQSYVLRPRATDA